MVNTAPMTSSPKSYDFCDSCAACGRTVAPKNRYACGACEKPLCKDCTQFLEEDSFSFLKEVPETLAHTEYCGSCYDEKVAPALASYATALERARELVVFYKNERNLPAHRALNKKVTV